MNQDDTSTACLQETPATYQANSPDSPRPVTPWMSFEEAAAIYSKMPRHSYSEAYASIRRNLGQVTSESNSAAMR
ncbi:MAG: hypothetical protein ACKVY0_06560 [Prosthecobacter sp.]|uniref:hypothetical protein n=1 Tax=Prosthecobacter sp. TaxID=1965333 RepID=UPI00390380C2